MARPKAFDPDTTLVRAAELFRCRGYEATSMQDLVDTLGLSRSSIYDTFGSKHDLYLQALRRYRTDAANDHAALLANDAPAMERLERMLNGIVAHALADPHGCFVANAAMEVGALDAEVERSARAGLDGVTRLFTELLRTAQAEGDLTAEKDPQVLAHFLTATAQGIRVLAKTKAGRTALQNTIDVALSALR
ncbi:MAG: TetR/AcrR family transcriptional regulator [Rhodothermales bacterium]